MTELITVIGISVTASFAVLLLKQYRPEFAMAVAAAAGIAAAAILLGGGILLADTFGDILNNAGVDGSVFGIVLKSLGICYISGFAADLCRDFGQTSIAGKIELAGKIAVVILTIPLVKTILGAALEFIK